MSHALALTLHIVAGVAGLVLGPLAIQSAVRQQHTVAAEVYHWLVAATAVTAIGLAFDDWSGLWWFVPIALGSYAFALAAYLPATRHSPGWAGRRIRGQGGSYIALWTAVFVVSAGGIPPLWVLPTAVGAPVVEWLSHRTSQAGAVRRSAAPPGT
ncbi:MAG: hypothetical protein ACRD0U_10135 [Acidimicrobiales bacterium]